MELENVSAGVPLDGLMIQFNKNTFGFAPAHQNIPVAPIQPGQTSVAEVAMNQTPNMVAPTAASILQVAIKCNQLGVLYLTDNVNVPALFQEDGRIESTQFVSSWKAIPDENEQQRAVGATIFNIDAIKQQLEANRVFVMAHKNVNGEDVLYVTARMGLPTGPVQLLLELRFVQGQPGVRMFYKSERTDLGPMALDGVASIITA